MKKLAVCLLSVITMVATLHIPAPAYGTCFVIKNQHAGFRLYPIWCYMVSFFDFFNELQYKYLPTISQEILSTYPDNSSLSIHHQHSLILPMDRSGRSWQYQL